MVLGPCLSFNLPAFDTQLVTVAIEMVHMV